MIPVTAEEVEDVEEGVGEEDDVEEVDVDEEEVEEEVEEDEEVKEEVEEVKEEVEDEEVEEEEETNLHLCYGRKYLLSLTVCRALLLSLMPKVTISVFLLTLSQWTSLSSSWMMIFLA